MTLRTPLRAALLSIFLAAAACIHGSPPAPEPSEPADVTVMTAVVQRFRGHPPHRGFPLAVAPVTLSYLPDRYPVALRDEFAGAAADLAAKSERLDPIRPPYLAGVAVRREGVYDPFDTQQYLLLRLSPVGFSPDSSRVALVVVFDCGPGCGSLAGVGLRRAANRGWRVAQVLRAAEPPPPETTSDPPG